MGRLVHSNRGGKGKSLADSGTDRCASDMEQIYQYHEKALQQRLEMLYQRNMYPLALELARHAGLDNEQQSVIYRKFGDHLYQKGDYDGSMVQYIRAIDTTEPSQVIRKVRAIATEAHHKLTAIVP